MKSTKELLAYKRDGGAWSAEEITRFITGVVDGSVTSAQASAFLMASCIRGLSAQETAALTKAMSESGVVLQRGVGTRRRIDKHSTGGVGDKVSLLVMPLAVACGLDVPMISGRGLGHTGGTVDKLESIVGFHTSMSIDEQQQFIAKHHAFMVGQSERIAPADKILYALRDATGTVENVGLITASILSKKLAEGLDGLVLDVKVGSAAFMKSLDQAEELASSMKSVGLLAGLPITVVFSRMDTMLGRTAGNWVEVLEAEQALANYNSAERSLVQVTIELVARMLVLADNTQSIDGARTRVQNAWSNGSAHAEFMGMVERQGGRWKESVDHYASAVHEIEISSDSEGYLQPLDGMSVAIALARAGGGRKHEADSIDHAVGIELKRDVGDHIQAGEVVARVFASDEQRCKLLAHDIQKLIQTTTAPRTEEPSIIIQIWQ